MIIYYPNTTKSKECVHQECKAHTKRVESKENPRNCAVDKTVRVRVGTESLGERRELCFAGLRELIIPPSAPAEQSTAQKPKLRQAFSDSVFSAFVLVLVVTEFQSPH